MANNVSASLDTPVEEATRRFLRLTKSANDANEALDRTDRTIQRIQERVDASAKQTSSSAVGTMWKVNLATQFLAAGMIGQQNIFSNLGSMGLYALSGLSPHFALAYASYKFAEGGSEYFGQFARWPGEKAAILQSMQITQRSQSLTGPEIQTGTGGLEGFELRKERENIRTINRMARQVATQNLPTFWGALSAKVGVDKEATGREKLVADIYHKYVEKLRGADYSEKQISDILKRIEHEQNLKGAEPSKEAKILAVREMIANAYKEGSWLHGGSFRSAYTQFFMNMPWSRTRTQEQQDLVMYAEMIGDHPEMIDRAIEKNIEMGMAKYDREIRTVIDTDKRGIRSAKTVGKVMNKLDSIRADETEFYFYKPVQQAQRRD